MTILYEDKSILVVDKPAGIATQSAQIGQADLESELKKYRHSKGEAPEIYVVHRLDQPVRGLLVFAKTKAAAAGLSKDMQKEAFSKDYLAKVLKPANPFRKAELTDFLVKDAKTNTSKVVTKTTPGAKEARLSYTMVSEDEKTMLLSVHLETGRHHQIRVQLAHAGMPILGDLKYGTEESRELSKEYGIETVALTAYKLSFRHPLTGKQMNFEIPDTNL